MSDEHQGASGAPRSAIGRRQWTLFHLLWGAAKESPEYVKADWIKMQFELEQAEAALRACAEALAPSPQKEEEKTDARGGTLDYSQTSSPPHRNEGLSGR